MSEAVSPNLKLTIKEAFSITGSRSSRDFLIHCLACTQSDTASGRGGVFWKSYREWSDVYISRTAVKNATEKLVSIGVLSVWQERDFRRFIGGIRTYYRVDVELLKKLLNKTIDDLDKTIKSVKKKVEKTFAKAVEMGNKVFNGKIDSNLKSYTSITLIDPEGYAEAGNTLFNEYRKTLPEEYHEILEDDITTHLDFWAMKESKGLKLYRELLMDAFSNKYGYRSTG